MKILLRFGLLCGAFLFAQAPKDLSGNWEGESVCTVPNSPCHSEGDKMTGTLKLDDGTLYRNISVIKNSKARR